MEEKDVEEFVDRIAETVDVREEIAHKLLHDTADRVEELAEEDDLVHVESRSEAERMAIAGVLLLTRQDVDEDFKQLWTEFSKNLTEFDVGLMYSFAHPDKAEKSIEQIHDELVE